MHPFGLITLLQFLWEYDAVPSLPVFVMVLGLVLTVVFLCRREQSYQDAPATIPYSPLSHATSFLKQRHDFFAWGFKVTNQRLFQFRFLRVSQTSVSLWPRLLVDDDALSVNID